MLIKEISIAFWGQRKTQAWYGICINMLKV